MSLPSFDPLLDFWFDPAHREFWFKKDPAFDARLAREFAPVAAAAGRGDLDAWQTTPRGALALVIALDQLPRNLHRDTANAFAQDAKALTVAQRAVAQGFDAALDDDGRAFLYMPYMHAESLATQERGVELYAAAGLSHNLRHARQHRDIIARFGRFPHRNAPLDRTSTPDEAAYLARDDAFRG
ncbi:MAG: DUF924 family protein [Candidatus Competibacterales bacterium]